MLNKFFDPSTPSMHTSNKFLLYRLVLFAPIITIIHVPGVIFILLAVMHIQQISKKTQWTIIKSCMVCYYWAIFVDWLSGIHFTGISFEPESEFVVLF